MNDSYKRFFFITIAMFVGYPLSLVNQQLIAYFFGTSKELDLYLMLLAVITSLNVFFFPVKDTLTPHFFKLKEKSLLQANRFFSEGINLFLLFLLGMVCLLIVSVLVYPKIWYITLPYMKGYHVQAKLIPYVIGLSVYLGFSNITVFLQNLLLAYNQQFFQVLQKFYGTLISIILLLWLSSVYHEYTLVLAGIASMSTLLILQLFFFSKTEVKYSFFAKPNLPKYLLTTYFMLGLYHFADTIYLFIEKWFLLSVAKDGYVSSFQYAFSLVSIPSNLFVLPLFGIMYPKILENFQTNNIKNIGVIFFKYNERIWLLLGFCSLFAFTFAREIIYLIYYQGQFNLVALSTTKTIFEYLAFYMLFEGVNFTLSNICISINKVRFILYIVLLRILTGLAFLVAGKVFHNVSLLLLSIPVKTVVAALLFFFVFLFKILPYNDRKELSKLYLPRLWRIGTILCTCFCISYYLKQFLLQNAFWQHRLPLHASFISKIQLGIVLLLASIVFLCIYIFILWLFSLIKNEDIAKVIHSIKLKKHK